MKWGFDLTVQLKSKRMTADYVRHAVHLQHIKKTNELIKQAKPFLSALYCRGYGGAICFEKKVKLSLLQLFPTIKIIKFLDLGYYGHTPYWHFWNKATGDYLGSVSTWNPNLPPPKYRFHPGRLRELSKNERRRITRFLGGVEQGGGEAGK